MMWPCTTFPWLWDDVTALWRHVTYHASCDKWRHVTYHASCDNSSHTSYNSHPSSTHTHHIIYRTFQFSYRTLILYMTLLHYHNTYIYYIIISLHLTLSWHLYYYIITLNITLSLHLHYIFITLIISHCIIITLLLLFNILNTHLYISYLSPYTCWYTFNTCWYTYNTCWYTYNACCYTCNLFHYTLSHLISHIHKGFSFQMFGYYPECFGNLNYCHSQPAFSISYDIFNNV